MIQRKQTLFLLIAVAAMAICFFFPTASMTATASMGQQVSGELRLTPQPVAPLADQLLEADEIVVDQKWFINVWPLIALTLAGLAVAAVSIFFYKKRMTQVKIVACGFLLCVVELFLVFFWAVDAWIDRMTPNMGLADVSVTYEIGAWAPIVAIVMLFLAQRSIKKDEAKVRAADRLR